MTKFFITAFATLLIVGVCYWGCEPKKSETLKTEAPDAAFYVTVHGEQLVVGDPWMANIMAFADTNQLATSKTEVYTTEISEETVKFDWIDNTTCLITFAERDGSTKQIRVIKKGDLVRITNMDAELGFFTLLF